MDNRPPLIDPLVDNRFRKIKIIEHDMPDQYKRHELAWMKEEVSRELYKIIEQSTYPCVVYIDETIKENVEGDLVTYKMMDKLMIEVFIFPVERKWKYSFDQLTDLHYQKVEEKETLWTKIWKSLQYLTNH